MKKHTVSYSLLAIMGLAGCTQSADKPVAICDEVTEVTVGDQVSKVITVNCDTESLAKSIKQARSGDIVLVKGVCKETRTVEINQDGITLQGMGAKITGVPGTDVISVNASGVTISHLDISGGLNGVTVSGNGSVDAKDLFIHDNKGFGIIAGAGKSDPKTLNTLQGRLERITSKPVKKLSNVTRASATVGPDGCLIIDGEFGGIQDGFSQLILSGNTNIYNNNSAGGVWIKNNAILSIISGTNTMNNNGLVGVLIECGSRGNVFNANLNVTGNGDWGIVLFAKPNTLEVYNGSTTISSNNDANNSNPNNENLYIYPTSCIRVNPGASFSPQPSVNNQC